jgi:hypothetical protein
MPVAATGSWKAAKRLDWANLWYAYMLLMLAIMLFGGRL